MRTCLAVTLAASLSLVTGCGVPTIDDDAADGTSAQTSGTTGGLMAGCPALANKVLVARDGEVEYAVRLDGTSFGFFVGLDFDTLRNRLVPRRAASVSGMILDGTLAISSRRTNLMKMMNGGRVDGEGEDEIIPRKFDYSNVECEAGAWALTLHVPRFTLEPLRTPEDPDRKWYGWKLESKSSPVRFSWRREGLPEWAREHREPADD